MYENVIRYVREHPWAIQPHVLETIASLISARAAGERLTDEEIAARLEAAPRRERKPMAAPSNIAVLPLFGVLAHRMGSFEAVSGGTSTEGFAKLFEASVDDPAITAIVLDVDSPGGSVHGVQELADLIFEARGTKPIVAIANGTAGSAAVWVATQADEFVATPSGQVGSIGVVAIHNDLSKRMETEGIRRTFVHSSRFKVEGNEAEPLSDEARAALQTKVDDYDDRFVKAVARGRGVAQRTVRKEFGEGRMLLAPQAAEAGLIDRVETMDALLDRLSRRQARGAQRGARSEADQPIPQEDRMATKPSEASAAKTAEPAAGPAPDPKATEVIQLSREHLDELLAKAKAEGIESSSERMSALEAEARHSAFERDEARFLKLCQDHKAPPSVRDILRPLFTARVENGQIVGRNDKGEAVPFDPKATVEAFLKVQAAGAGNLLKREAPSSSEHPLTTATERGEKQLIQSLAKQAKAKGATVTVSDDGFGLTAQYPGRKEPWRYRIDGR